MRRATSFIRVLVALVLALGQSLPGPAFAHTRSESHSSWLVKGSTAHLQFTVPDLESKRITPEEELITKDNQTLDVSEHAESPLQNAGFLEISCGWASCTSSPKAEMRRVSRSPGW
jgi:hypothetical protein